LNQQYGDWKGITKVDVTTIDDDDDDANGNPMTDMSLEETHNPETRRDSATTVGHMEIIDGDDNPPVNPKLSRELQKLSVFLSPGAETKRQAIVSALWIWSIDVLVISSLVSSELTFEKSDLD
jgi:hypothetical protein